MRNPSRSLDEKYHLIMECRSSGLTDKEWCEGKGIPQSTFYAWLKQVKTVDAGGIPKAYKKSPPVHTPPEIVRVDLPNKTQSISLDDAIIRESQTTHQTSPQIVIEINGIKIHVFNNADPLLLAQALKIVRSALC
jgi:transposase-like protein